MSKPINWIKLSSRSRTDQTTENNSQEMAACLFSRKLLQLIYLTVIHLLFPTLITNGFSGKYVTLSHARFKGKGRDQKNKKAAFTVARMKFLLNFQKQKTTQERIIVESFLLSARLQVRQPSLLHDIIHALISVIHEKVYEKIQIEVSKKKLDLLTSVAAVHESQRPKLVDERDEVFYAGFVATR